VADDKNLLSVSLQRTADNKYMRPARRGGRDRRRLPEDARRAVQVPRLIIGSVEAGLFTGDQLQMIADFVDRRGGGLLVLGGRDHSAKAVYGGTPVADALPLSSTRARAPPSPRRWPV
jgi:hypothetical protein